MLGMYFQEITVIDGATIDKNGWLIGQSVNPCARLFGALNGEEQVIADFSSAKKHIKEIIDDKETGLDHKLWVFSDSNCKALAGVTNNHLNIVSPIIDAQVPNNGVVFMRRISNGFGDVGDVSEAVCSYLSVHVLSELKRRWPQKYAGLESIVFSDGNHMSVPTSHTPKDVAVFRYTHGLAKSTSWGCQLIAHGHLSYVAVKDKRGNVSTEWQDKIAKLLHGAYIVSNEHIVPNEKFPNSLHIAYQSMSRGNMSLVINQSNVSSHGIGDVFITEDEPTIENIMKTIIELFHSEMVADEIHQVFISEGSNKGACYLFN